MKIMLLASIWGGHPGGIDRYLIALIRSLTRMGHSCSLVYSLRKGDAIEKNLPAFQQYYVRHLNDFPNKKNIEAGEELAHVADQEKPDVIFVHHVNHYTALDRVASLYPMIAMFHDYRPICLRETRRYYFTYKICRHPLGPWCYLYGHVLRKPASGHFFPRWQSLAHAKKLLTVLKKAQALIVPSDFVRQMYLKNGFTGERLILLPHFFSTPDWNHENSYPREKIVLFAGRLTDRYKGADILLDVISRCDETIKLVVAGDGGYAKKVKNLCAKKGLQERVKFLGWVAPEQMDEIYRKAMVLAMPSLWAEPFGLVGLEAMANGTPVVAFDLGGVRQWLRDGVTGYLIPWLDRDLMADKIMALANNPLLAKKMGLAGFTHVKNEHAEDAYLEKLLQIFDQAKRHFENPEAESVLRGSF